MSGGSKEGHSIVKGGAHGGPQASVGHRVCYDIQDRAKAEASDAVITYIVLVCNHLASVLFDTSSTYSYVSSYFGCDVYIMYESLVELSYVSTSVGESFVANWVYWGSIVIFIGRDTVDELILLDMFNFDMILGMDWLSFYHAILDCHV